MHRQYTTALIPGKTLARKEEKAQFPESMSQKKKLHNPFIILSHSFWGLLNGKASRVLVVPSRVSKNCFWDVKLFCSPSSMEGS